VLAKEQVKQSVQTIQQETFNIIWNISDPMATGASLDLWFYTENGNIVVITSSGFYTSLSNTSDVMDRTFIGFCWVDFFRQTNFL